MYYHHQQQQQQQPQQQAAYGSSNVNGYYNHQNPYQLSNTYNSNENRFQQNYVRVCFLLWERW
jgi:hypothetical protein